MNRINIVLNTRLSKPSFNGGGKQYYQVCLFKAFHKVFKKILENGLNLKIKSHRQPDAASISMNVKNRIMIILQTDLFQQRRG